MTCVSEGGFNEVSSDELEGCGSYFLDINRRDLIPVKCRPAWLEEQSH